MLPLTGGQGEGLPEIIISWIRVYQRMEAGGGVGGEGVTHVCVTGS
jgi:hypothetical protein